MNARSLVLMSLFFINASVFAQENPPIIDVDVQVGVNAVTEQSAQGDTQIATGVLGLESNLNLAQLEGHKLLPFKVELWVGSTPNPVQLRNLEASLAESILKYGFSLSYLNVQHQVNGVGENQFTTTGITPVLVNYRHTLMPDGKLVVEGYLGAGINIADKDLVNDRPYAGMAHLKENKNGFYLPVGTTLYGENDIIEWRVEANYVLANSETEVTKQASPKVKVHNVHNMQMQTFHAGAQVELRLQNLIKSKLTQGVSLFARVDYNTGLATDNLDVIKYSKKRNYYDNQLMNSSSTPTSNFNNVSGQVGIKINIGNGGKKKSPRPVF